MEKKQEQTAVLDESREEAVLEQCRQSVSNKKPSKKTIVVTFESIMEHSRTYQKNQLEG